MPIFKRRSNRQAPAVGVVEAPPTPRPTVEAARAVALPPESGPASEGGPPTARYEILEQALLDVSLSDKSAASSLSRGCSAHRAARTMHRGSVFTGSPGGWDRAVDLRVPEAAWVVTLSTGSIRARAVVVRYMERRGDTDVTVTFRVPSGWLGERRTATSSYPGPIPALIADIEDAAGRPPQLAPSSIGSRSGRTIRTPMTAS